MTRRDKPGSRWCFVTFKAAMMRIFLLFGFFGIGTLVGHGEDGFPLLQQSFRLSVLTGSGVVTEGKPAVDLQTGFLFNLNRHLGVVADFGYAQRTVAGEKFKEGQYLFGSQFSIRRNRSIAFFHALAGVTDMGTATKKADKDIYCTNLSCDTEDFHRIHRPFTLGFGGGLDVFHVFRVLQIDYLPYRLDGKWDHRFRIGAGFVLPWM